MISNTPLLLPQKLKDNQSWWLAGMSYKCWKQIIGEANLVTSIAPSDCRWCVLLHFHSHAALNICSSYKNAYAHQNIFYLTVNSINLEWPEITWRDHTGSRTRCCLEDETKRSVYAPSTYTQPGRYNLSYLSEYCCDLKTGWQSRHTSDTFILIWSSWSFPYSWRLFFGPVIMLWR